MQRDTHAASTRGAEAGCLVQTIVPACTRGGAEDATRLTAREVAMSTIVNCGWVEGGRAVGRKGELSSIGARQRQVGKGGRAVAETPRSRDGQTVQLPAARQLRAQLNTGSTCGAAVSISNLTTSAFASFLAFFEPKRRKSAKEEKAPSHFFKLDGALSKVQIYLMRTRCRVTSNNGAGPVIILLSQNSDRGSSGGGTKTYRGRKVQRKVPEKDESGKSTRKGLEVPRKEGVKLLMRFIDSSLVFTTNLQHSESPWIFWLFLGASQSFALTLCAWICYDLHRWFADGQQHVNGNGTEPGPD
ncbi:hypothetical protein FB45DRAFT_870627 [Roridomyces roridus]|uniref:Uncharacterized protein n=1 Tax=Roridomyces roridus TaxID=1738132 RepID=A0AAD7BIX7_9AGAR|nr:hypothetical protein FB45DRAFT_870627 [Roridomyces roridus]